MSKEESWYSLERLLSAKFRAGDGGGDGYVERLGGGASHRVVGDKEFVRDVLCCRGADAISLVAHDDDAVGRQ